MKKIGFKFMAALALVLVAVGCSSRDRSVCHVNPESWCKPATVAIDNPATQTLLDVVFYVRCNSDFNLRTLPVVIRSIAPNGLECIDQAFWVFDDCGGPAAVASLQKIAYRSTCLLDQVGEYKFVVSPLEPVRGVEAVVVDIEKYN